MMQNTFTWGPEELFTWGPEELLPVRANNTDLSVKANNTDGLMWMVWCGCLMDAQLNVGRGFECTCETESNTITSLDSLYCETS